MRCPFCGSPDSQVKDSRPSEDGDAAVEAAVARKVEALCQRFPIY